MKYKIEYKEKYGSLDDYHNYVRLVNEVNKIDPYLAKVLTRQHHMPPGFIYTDDLTSCFVWSAHPYVEQEQWEMMRDALKGGVCKRIEQGGGVMDYKEKAIKDASVEELLYELLLRGSRHPLPQRKEFYGKGVETIIGIGLDHHACIQTFVDDFVALEKLVMGR